MTSFDTLETGAKGKGCMGTTAVLPCTLPGRVVFALSKLQDEGEPIQATASRLLIQIVLDEYSKLSAGES